MSVKIVLSEPYGPGVDELKLTPTLELGPFDRVAYEDGWWFGDGQRAYCDLQKQNKREYPDLIEPVRERLHETGIPYVIENIDSAPLRDPIMLCGTMFPGLRILRHRLFESNVPIEAPTPHPKHPLVFTHDKRKAHHGKLDQNTSFVQVTGGGNCTVANARDAMGIDWMTKNEINEAIPPAYTQHVGCYLMDALR